MPSYTDVISTPWNESDTFRETTLQLLDDLDDREAFRRAGRVLYDLAVVERLRPIRPSRAPSCAP